MNLQQIERALAEVEAELTRLQDVRMSLRRVVGAGPAVTPSNGSSKAAAHEVVTTTHNRRRRLPGSGSYPRGQRPADVIREVLARATEPLSTQEIYQRMLATGFRFNRVRSKPTSLVYGTLTYMERNGQLRRIGAEWVATAATTEGHKQEG